MTFQGSVKTCLSKYIDIQGRASRSEYWWFFLFCLIINTIAMFINQNLEVITSLLLLLPSLTVMIRRLHDVDKSGWWVLILLLPIIGLLVILYFMIIEGTKGPNRFGNPPSSLPVTTTV
jgi:uncharacterized membrane protein YhaH (DUF805 family)